ncbi:MAG: DEAD/DEAH box helicase [Planctomycetota bacterium]
MQFSEFDLDQRLLNNVRTMGFTQPTPIQEATIPAAMKDQDVLGSAETGTGKTAAYLLPTIQWLLEGRDSRSPRALVLVPTRELALQVAEHGEELARGIRLKFVTVYGGVDLGSQIKACQRGVDVVIATPGRLLDLLRRRQVHFDRLETLVLDEADRMLDIGFLPDIRRIVRELPTDRQTMLFSATIAPVYHLAREVTVDAIRVEVAKVTTPEAIEQVFYPVLEHRKTAVLEHILSDEKAESVLVFTKTKTRADLVAHDLKRAGLKADRIHGDRAQKERIRALESFRHGRTRILVATDVAARGIDITGISHVVNYDLPNKSDDYVHRIGRTGRADAPGIAWSLVSPMDEVMAERIERAMGGKVERREPDGVDTGRPVRKEEPAKKKPGGWNRQPSRRRRR